MLHGRMVGTLLIYNYGAVISLSSMFFCKMRMFYILITLKENKNLHCFYLNYQSSNSEMLTEILFIAIQLLVKQLTSKSMLFWIIKELP